MRLQLGRGTRWPAPDSMVPAVRRFGERPTGGPAVRRHQRSPITRLVDRDPLHLQSGRLRPPRLARLAFESSGPA